MRRIARLVIGAAAITLVFCVVFLIAAIASREFETVWLPITLVAASGTLLTMLPNPGQARSLAWLGVACGVLVMWMLSEPAVELRRRPDLRAVAIFLAALGACSELALVLRGTARGSALRSICYWGAGVVLMSWVIAFFSSPSGSSGGMIAFVMHVLGLSQSQAETAVLIVRKCIHFSFYGLLGWTGFSWARSLDLGTRRAVLFGLALTLVFASFDEGRQTFFADRTGSAWDVLLDLCGGAVFILLSLGAARRLSVGDQ